MNLIKFALYYLNLQLKTRLGISRTAHPLGIKWRWRYWREKQPKKNRVKEQNVLRSDLRNVWQKLFR